ncbi:hypothetical protein WKC39_005189, partial [Escherichia coli]
MSKKFTKTILSSAVAGLLMMSSGAIAAEMAPVTVGDYTINFHDNGQRAQIVDNAGVQGNGMQVDTTTGRVTVVNIDEVKAAVKEITSRPEIAAAIKTDNNLMRYIAQTAGEAARYSVTLPSEFPSLTLDNIKNLTPENITAIKQNVESVAKVITTKTAADYNQAVSNGMSSEAALTVAKKDGGAVLKEFNRIDSGIDQLNKDTTFAIDADGNITLNETAGTGERYGVKDVVADLVADTTVYAEEDGSLTMDNSAPARKRVNEALVDLDKSVRERTTVGVNSDGTLTRAEGAATTIAVNDGLVQLSGRTDRIDAT